MSHSAQIRGNLSLAIFLSLLTLIWQLLGSFLSHSLALLSDSFHVLGDIVSLSIAFLALKIIVLPPNNRKTFGYHRAEVFASLLNGLILFSLAFFILFESYQRILSPQPVKSIQVVFFACLGLLPNLWTVLKLRHEENLTVKSAFFHSLFDMLSSIIVILSGLLMTVFKTNLLDIFASVCISILIIISSLKILSNAFDILFEGVPKNLALESVSQAICQTNGVLGTHDLHVWTVCPDNIYLTGHLVVSPEKTHQEIQTILKELEKKLLLFGIKHLTFQVETPDTSCEKIIKCEVLH